jgi:6-phosphogluconate dehydrogenase (decarboxylating)
MASSAPSTISVFGLGAMGGALAKALLKSAKHPNITIWNRTPTRPNVAELVKEGAKFEADFAKAVAVSDSLLFCIIGYAPLEQQLSVIDQSVLNGKQVVNLTNGTPKQARDLEKYMESAGVASYVDGAVMATPSMVGTQHSAIFLSGGAPDVIKELKPLIEVLGSIAYFGPDPGAASLYNNAMLAGMYGMFTGAFTAIGLIKRQQDRDAQSNGQDAGSVAPMVGQLLVPTLTVLVPLVSQMAMDIDTGNKDAGQHPLEMQYVALQNIESTCEAESVDVSWLKPLRAIVGNALQEDGANYGMSFVLHKVLNP